MSSFFISLRPNTPADIDFYSSLFTDEEWMFNSGFRFEDFASDDQLKSFMKCHHPLEFKGVLVDNNAHEKIGFCHFKHIDENDLEICGGIRTDLLNKGLGLYSIVYSLDFIFKHRSFGSVHSLVFQDNLRSIRIHQKTGFNLAGTVKYDVRLFYHFVLTRDIFYSTQFNRYFLSRHGLLCSEV